MPKFSIYFNIGLNQRQLDFVDIDTDDDIAVYVDPYAIEIQNDEWSADASEHIRTFFSQVLSALRAGNDFRAESLMSNLREPKETFLGVSKGKPRGRGVGKQQARRLIRAMKESQAYKSGLIKDLSEMALYVDGIDKDKISDLTTNIIRRKLVQYTQQQCDLFGIETKYYNGPPHWNPDIGNWQTTPFHLPFIDGEAVMLVPKYAVRRSLSLNSQEFYTKQITDFLVQEQERAAASLANALGSDGRGRAKRPEPERVFKSEVREKNPKSKKLIAEIVSKHPQLLDLYKDAARRSSTVQHFSDDDLDVSEVCVGLIRMIDSMPTGQASAGQYHRAVLGVMTAVFYPDLIQPHREAPLNDGRRRADIIYTNASDRGFFSNRRDEGRVNANYVVVECKNYSDDVGNPEVDQLVGRFSDGRGKLGILAYRKSRDEKLLIDRCRDHAKEGRGYVICLSDEDLKALLAFKAALKEDEIQNFLQRKYFEILS